MTIVCIAMGGLNFDALVEEVIVDEAQDVRIRSNAHITRLNRAIRMHCYTICSLRTTRWYVVDHWATMALSEFAAYKGDVDSFLKNVQSRFLRGAEMNVPDEDYETYKDGTTEFLRFYLTEYRPYFPAPPPRSWVGARPV